MDEGQLTFVNSLSRFGYDMRCTERHVLIRILLEKLGGDERIITGERVANILHHADGVQVLSESGRTYAGNIVVGCDGVHSVVRRLMWERADEIQPGLIGTPDKQGIRPKDGHPTFSSRLIALLAQL